MSNQVKCARKRVLKYHFDYVYNIICCTFPDRHKRIISCSRDNTIRVYNIVTKSLDNTVHVNEKRDGVVGFIKFFNSRLFSSTRRGKVLIWKFRNPKGKDYCFKMDRMVEMSSNGLSIRKFLILKQKFLVGITNEAARATTSTASYPVYVNNFVKKEAKSEVLLLFQKIEQSGITVNDIHHLRMKENCFVIATDTITRIEYELDYIPRLRKEYVKIVDRLDFPTQRNTHAVTNITKLESFYNADMKEERIVSTCLYGNNIVIWTIEGIPFKRIKLRYNLENRMLDFSDKSISSILFVNNKTFFLGDSRGCLLMLSLQKSKEEITVLIKKHRDWVDGFCYIAKRRNNFWFASCSHDETICIFKVDGVCTQEFYRLFSNMRLDERERIEFTKDDVSQDFMIQLFNKKVESFKSMM